jgi:hypothetical protein
MEMLLGFDPFSSVENVAKIYSLKDQAQDYTIDYEEIVQLLVLLVLTLLVSSLFLVLFYLLALRWIWPAHHSH